MLVSGNVLAVWRKTSFKTKNIETSNDNGLQTNCEHSFVPNKSLHKWLWAESKNTLETNHPQDQHGFRSNEHIAKHLLTVNVILDKTLEMDQPLWIITLDLSKALRPGQLGIILASGGWSWRITTLGFFFSGLFSRDKVSQSCFTGQLPGIGTVFILASLQMCKVQRQSPLTNQG